MHRALHHPTLFAGITAVSIRSDRSFPRHSHDEFGIGYVVSGAQRSWSGRGPVEAEADDIITVNPNELHDGIVARGSPRHWRMLYLSPEAIAAVFDRKPASLELEAPVLRDTRKRTKLAAAIADVTAPQSDRGEAEERLLLALHALTSDLDRDDTAGRTALPPCAAIARVRAQIEAEYAAPLSLADYAATAAMSRTKVLRRFTREVGTTPHAFLTQHRVKAARRAMACGTPLAAAALEAGFCDQSHMTRAFVRQFGMTPGRYIAAISFNPR